jgi:hypothetical protein
MLAPWQMPEIERHLRRVMPVALMSAIDVVDGAPLDRHFVGVCGEESTMEDVAVIGLDLAKSVFQVHGVDGGGRVVLRWRLSRSKLLPFFAGLPRCLVGMETCASANHWAREFMALDHEVRLMPPQYVKPYVKRSKNDASDAEAICEAVTRPTMRFVSVKSAEQQSVLVLHRTRLVLTRQCTQLPAAGTCSLVSWCESIALAMVYLKVMCARQRLGLHRSAQADGLRQTQMAFSSRTQPLGPSGSRRRSHPRK